MEATAIHEDRSSSSRGRPEWERRFWSGRVDTLEGAIELLSRREAIALRAGNVNRALDLGQERRELIEQKNQAKLRLILGDRRLVHG